MCYQGYTWLGLLSLDSIKYCYNILNDDSRCGTSKTLIFSVVWVKQQAKSSPLSPYLYIMYRYITCLYTCIFMPPDRMFGGILFLSCPSVCLSVCLSVVNFKLRYNFWTLRDRDFIWHAYSTNDARSNDTKVNDLVTLTLTLKLKIAFFNFVAAGGIL